MGFDRSELLRVALEYSDGCFNISMLKDIFRCYNREFCNITRGIYKDIVWKNRLLLLKRNRLARLLYMHITPPVEIPREGTSTITISPRSYLRKQIIMHPVDASPDGLLLHGITVVLKYPLHGRYLVTCGDNTESLHAMVGMFNKRDCKPWKNNLYCLQLDLETRQTPIPTGEIIHIRIDTFVLINTPHESDLWSSTRIMYTNAKNKKPLPRLRDYTPEVFVEQITIDPPNY